MAHPGDVVEAPLLGARATFLKPAEQTNGELLRVEVVLPPASPSPSTSTRPRRSAIRSCAALSGHA
jgi:hypothetical protein